MGGRNGGRARGRSGGRPCTAGQSCYVPLGRHLVDLRLKHFSWLTDCIQLPTRCNIKESIGLYNSNAECLLSLVIRCTVGASIVATLRGYQLDIVVQLPSELKNTGLRGLLGNYNDNPSDDLISRNGQTVDTNSNEETIYYSFGETCKLMSPLYIMNDPGFYCASA